MRVFNTLNLYEKDVAKNYVSASYKNFTIRYHREEKPILERYVPELLDRAFKRDGRALRLHADDAGRHRALRGAPELRDPHQRPADTPRFRACVSGGRWRR